MSTKKSDWEIERDKQNKSFKKGISSLTNEQKNTLKKLEDTLDTALCSLFECQDMWMSDIKELHSAYHAIQRQFTKIGK